MEEVRLIFSSNHLFCAMKNRLDVPKVVRATPAPFQKQIASSPQSNKPAKAVGLKDSAVSTTVAATADVAQQNRRHGLTASNNY